MGALGPSPTLDVARRGGAVHRVCVGHDDGTGGRSEPGWSPPPSASLPSSDLADLAAFVGYDESDSTGEAHEQGVADLVAALDRDPDVTRYENGEFVVATPDPVPPGSFGFAFVGQPGGGPGLFGTPVLLDGRYPAAPDEMLVNERAAKLFDLDVGERHPLLAMACFDCEQERLDAEVTITGIARLAGDLVGDPSTLGLFIVPPTFLDGEWTKYARPGTIVQIHLADGVDPVAVSQRLSPLIESGDIGNTGASLRVAERAGDLQRNALLAAAVVIGTIGLVVAAQAMGRHISVRRDDEQILLGLGFDRLRRMAAVAAVLAPAVVVGSVLAGPIAVGLSPLLPLGLSRRADPDLGVHLDLAVVVVGVLVTSVIGAMMIVFVAVRWLQSPAESSSRASVDPRHPRRSRCAAGSADRESICDRSRPRFESTADACDDRRRCVDGCGRLRFGGDTCQSRWADA